MAASVASNDKLSDGFDYRLETLASALKPKGFALGVTQGGSSKKGRGAKVAATDANTQKPK